MIETSLGITAAAHFAPLLDYADFDGAALLADDPYIGATIAGGRIMIPTGSGAGVGPAVTPVRTHRMQSTLVSVPVSLCPF